MEHVSKQNPGEPKGAPAYDAAGKALVDLPGDSPVARALDGILDVILAQPAGKEA